MIQKIKKTITIIICLLALSFSIFSSVSIHAESDEEKVGGALNDYTEEGDNATDVFGRFLGSLDSGEELSQFERLLERVFTPQYMNNASSGVLQKELDDPRIDGYLCNPDEPQNLLNHNCDVPNFSAEFLQALVSLVGGTGGLKNAEVTSAKPAFSFGTPNDIPEDNVPTNPNDRAVKYTGLEIFGYNLKFTTYDGEWDRIVVSTQSRMLTNFGFMDNLRLTGNSIWNGMTSGAGALINGFDFNPIKWALNVWTETAGGVFNTIADTSDLNVIATRYWSRPDFNSTLYNVYVLTDKEVVEESAVRYMRFFTQEMSDLANSSPELQEAIALELLPDFTYDPHREKEESIRAREEAIAENERLIALEEETGDVQELVEVPAPVYMTESEQLDEWREENSSFLERGRAQGLYNEEAETYAELSEYWAKQWGPYADREFNANNSVVAALSKLAISSFFESDPFADPKQPISHYVCADTQGNPLRDDSGNYIYLYTAYNEGATEHVNPNCAPARASIRGGYFGSSWHVDVANDTRRTMYEGVSIFSFIPGLGDVQDAMTNSFMSVSAFMAQFTNMMIGLSFSNILESLGITAMVATLMASFRDTIFFPLSVLAAAFGAILLLLNAIRGGYAQALKTLFTTVLLFVVGTVVLYHPDVTVKIVEDVPIYMETLIADSVLSSHASDLCTTDAEDGGVRSAQCYVWNFMVFQPWVQGQFGTNFDNLYANGYEDEIVGTSMNNTNENLVGNAEVKMGGGVSIHNWALYQLQMTKTGSITETGDPDLLGTVNPNIYRIVDMQAGPNGGEGTDSTYLQTWSGKTNNRVGVSMVALLQSIVGGIVIILFSFFKIQYSFLVSIYLIMLPVMMLKMFTQKGQHSLKAYLATILSLIMKRIVSVVLLMTLLRLMIELSAVSSASLFSGFIGICVIFGFFLLYRKELTEQFNPAYRTGVFSNNPDDIKQMFSQVMPQRLQQEFYMGKANVKGKAAGTLGGAMAGFKFGVNKKAQEKFSDTPPGAIGENTSILKSMIDGAHLGSLAGGAMSENLARNKLRRTGFTIGYAMQASKEHVIKEGAKKITEQQNPIESDTYKEIISHGIDGTRYKSTKDLLQNKDAQSLLDKDIQREVREQAEIRKQVFTIEDEREVPREIEGTQEIADKIDRENEINTLRALLFNPVKLTKHMLTPKEKAKGFTHKSADFKEIQKKQAEERKARENAPKTEAEFKERINKQVEEGRKKFKMGDDDNE